MLVVKEILVLVLGTVGSLAIWLSSLKEMKTARESPAQRPDLEMWV